MMYVPIGKAIIPVNAQLKCNKECMNEDYQCQTKSCCDGCELEDCVLACLSGDREDGLNVIFKMVDYPG